MSENKTVNKLTSGQIDAISRMPEIADSKIPQVHSTLPASIYIDPDRFEKEVESIFKKQPMLVAPSSALSEPNSYMMRDILNVPVLITRNKDGEIKAFLNICTHRGSKLCSKYDAVKGARIVCPYHAWTFGVEGNLLAIPREELFPGIKKENLGLTELPCVEAGGLIWLGLTPGSEVDFSSVTGELAADLSALGLPELSVFKKAIFEVKANWKLVMDTMNDSYHVVRLHRNSVGKFFVDAQNIIDPIGPHLRVSAHRGNFIKPESISTFQEARKIMVFAYTLFPNGVVVVSPDFISLGIMEPVNSGHTRVHYFMLAEKSDNPELLNKLEKSFSLMETTFGQEDYWAAEQCYEGLKAGYLKEVQLGGLEVQVPFFHNIVAQLLGEK